jgi:hypothetical protein
MLANLRIMLAEFGAEAVDRLRRCVRSSSVVAVPRRSRATNEPILHGGPPVRDAVVETRTSHRACGDIRVDLRGQESSSPYVIALRIRGEGWRRLLQIGDGGRTIVRFEFALRARGLRERSRAEDP